MLEVITGFSLASAAGLNAYIPLLVLGLLSKFTDIVALPSGWVWLENWWSLGIIAVLLVVELFVDKVPALDTVNDVLQSVVRPASGGLVFAAGATSDTVAVADPEAFVHSSAFWPFVIGVVVALVPHLLKLVARPILNTATGGAAAPVMSTIEDIFSVVIAVLAIVLPVLALALIVGGIFFLVRRVRRARTRRAAKRAAQA